ncbi:serine/threonine-protein kinase [Xanthomonas massiliensis]|uniref:serine/threonine-protein kinase n=1 Tax=Xanthomonas massiliensis TaxID=1720302 RepID=UPI0008244776|nr:serine/threonine-protein kinase [Xanthomonas massiliensis]
MSQDPETWRQVRRLFEAVCELPEARWRQALEQLSGDPVVVAEALALLSAQTVQMGGVPHRVDEMLARVAGPELQAGDRIDHWRLTRHLASGGMGSVFAAERADALYRQQVAIKLLRGWPDAGTSQRLAAERQILASLRHPGIARLYDGGTTPAGQPYLVMEYVDGRTLDRYVQEERVGLDARLALFLKVCEAVQAAHAQLVLHCDIKPANVLVRADGDPVLLDFGIARLMDGGSADDRLKYCTVPYASPELLAGTHVGTAGDVFSLGVVLLELLADVPVARDLQASQASLPSPSRLAGTQCRWRGRLAGDLDAIVAKACRIDPRDRYGSVAELAQDIRRHLAHAPVLARAGGRLYRARRHVRRHWRAVVAAGVMLTMGSGFIVGLQRARDEARAQAEAATGISDFLVSAFNAADPKLRASRGAEQISARDVLDAGARHIDEDPAISPAARARLHAVIGRAYMNLTQTARAEPLLRRAAAELQAPGVDDPLQASAALHDLSLLLSRQSRGREALVPARHALALAERARDGDAIAGAHNVLGLALQQDDQLDAAERELRTALALRRAQADRDGANDRNYAGDILHNLALVARARGQYAVAEGMLRQERTDVLARYGSRSERYAGASYDLARVILSQGRLREGIALLESQLPLARQLYGEGSDGLVMTYMELAGAYQDLGDMPLSAEHYAQALAQLRIAGREGTQDHAILLNNMATLAEARGDVPAAESLYRQSLRLRRDLFGDQARATLTVEANLGRLLMRDGRLAQGRPLMDHAEEGLKRLLPAGTPLLRVQQMGQAELHLHLGELDRAQHLLDDALAGLDGDDAMLRDRGQALQAGIDARAGRTGASEAAWKDLVSRSAGRLDPAGLPLAKLRLSLAEAELANGEKAAARALVASAAPVLRQQMVAGAADLQRLQALDVSLH